MANQFGYTVLQTDRAGVWLADGYASIDGYGEPVYTTVPSGIVSQITRNSTGSYSIILKQAWYALVDAQIDTIIMSGAPLITQIVSFTVGDSSVLPIAAGGPGQDVTFSVYNLSGVATDIPVGDGFFFNLILKQSSA